MEGQGNRQSNSFRKRSCRRMLEVWTEGMENKYCNVELKGDIEVEEKWGDGCKNKRTT